MGANPAPRKDSGALLKSLPRNGKFSLIPFLFPEKQKALLPKGLQSILLLIRWPRDPRPRPAELLSASYNTISVRNQESVLDPPQQVALILQRMLQIGRKRLIGGVREDVADVDNALGRCSEQNPNQLASLLVDVVEKQSVQLEQPDKVAAKNRLPHVPGWRHAVLDAREEAYRPLCVMESGSCSFG
jgi:hypothetical protein